MKTQKTRLTALFIACLLFPAFSTAQVVTEIREADNFTSIEVSSVFNVLLSQDDFFFLEVEVDEEHLEYIDTRVKNGVLYIDYSRRARNLRDLDVRVTAPAIEMLKASGASNIRSEGLLDSPSLRLDISGASSMDLALRSEELTSNISGASNMKLTGSAAFHDLNASGVSTVRAYDLDSQHAIINSSGTASVRVTVLESVTAKASGASGITVRGNPPAAEVSTSGGATIRGVQPASATPAPIRDEETKAETKTDTLIISVGNRELLVVDGTRVQYRTRPQVSWRNEWTGFYLGINGYMTPGNSIDLDPEDQFMDLEYNNSIQVNLNLWQQNLVLARGSNSALGVYTGVGFSWNNYRFSNNIRLVREEDQLSHFTDTIHSFRKNKLTISHLNVPLMLEFQNRQRYDSRSNFHMSAGINVGMRLRSHTKQVYRFEGSRQKDKDYKDFHLAPFRYEAVARIGWGRFNFFATYALNEMFRSDRGPELYPFAVGIRIVDF